MNTKLLFAALLMTSSVVAQDVPEPAPVQPKKIGSIKVKWTEIERDDPEDFFFTREEIREMKRSGEGIEKHFPLFYTVVQICTTVGQHRECDIIRTTGTNNDTNQGTFSGDTGGAFAHDEAKTLKRSEEVEITAAMAKRAQQNNLKKIYEKKAKELARIRPRLTPLEQKEAVEAFKIEAESSIPDLVTGIVFYKDRSWIRGDLRRPVGCFVTPLTDFADDVDLGPVRKSTQDPGAGTRVCDFKMDEDRWANWDHDFRGRVWGKMTYDVASRRANTESNGGNGSVGTDPFDGPRIGGDMQEIQNPEERPEDIMKKLFGYLDAPKSSIHGQALENNALAKSLEDESKGHSTTGSLESRPLGLPAI